MRLFILFFCFIILPTSSLFGSESDLSNIIDNPKIQEIRNDTTLLKQKKDIRIKHQKKRLSLKKKKLKLFKKLKPKNDVKFWLWVISGLIAIIGGLIALGSSAWLIIAIIFGMLAYLGFIAYLFFRYIDKGFKLEWFWWLILTILVGGGITGIILLIGMNPVSSAIIGAVLYGVFGLIGIILFVMIFVAIFKGIASFFKALFHPFRR